MKRFLAVEMEEPKKRKTDPEPNTFLERWTYQYFFVHHDNKPTCLVCKDTVTTYKENDLKRHYDSKHKKQYGDIIGKNRDEKIAKLRKEIERSTNSLLQREQETEAITRASYRVAHILSKDLRSFSDGECVKKCMMAVMEEMYPEKKNAFKSVNLSTVTMTKQVEEIGENLHEKLKRKAAEFEMFSIAVDKWPDRNENIQLLVFIRGINNSFEVTEELAGMRCLRGSATTDDFFHAVSAIMNEYGLPWDKLVGVTTNGAKPMAESNSGLAAIISKKVVESNGTEPVKLHCIMHQHNLFSKVLHLDHVIKTVTSVLNYIKTQGFSHNEFKDLIADVETEYEDVLPGHEMRWLGRGKVIKRFFELRRQIEAFMAEKSKPVDQLKNPAWLSDLAVLCDMTVHVNKVRSKLEGKDKSITHFYSEVTAFQTKLQLFIDQAGKATLVHFPTCAALRQEEQSSKFSPKSRIIQYLLLLKNDFNERFDEFKTLKDEIRLFENPFTVDVSHAPEDLEQELINLQKQTSLLDKFRTMKLEEFYSVLPANTFPNIRKLAMRLITMFTNTQVCEEAFKMMKRATIKSVLQNRVAKEQVESVLRISVSSIEPDIEKLASKNLSSSEQPHTN